MGKRYLLTYRRDTDAARGDLIRQQLVRRFGASSVMDSLERMTPGQEFRSAIAQAINDCDGMLVLIGPDWLSATDRDGHRRLEDPHDLVRVEVAAAFAAGKTVIPVLLDGARMPRADELPPELVALTRRHALEVDTSRIDRAPLWEFIMQAPPSPSSARAELPPGSPDRTRMSQRRMGGVAGSAAGLIANAVRAAGRWMEALRSLTPEQPTAPPPTEPAAPAPTTPPKHAPGAEPVLLGITAPRSALPGVRFNAVLAAYIESARASAQAKLERLGGAGAVSLMDIPPDRSGNSAKTLRRERPELHFCVLIPDLTLRLPYLPTKAIALRVAQTIRRCAVGGI